MIERRCNFCGDLLKQDHQHPSMSIDHGHGGNFRVQITVTQHAGQPVQFDPPEHPYYIFSMFAPTRQEEAFDTCFGCAAHLVAVAYDQYVKGAKA